jgi:hypothetical protein
MVDARESSTPHESSVQPAPLATRPATLTPQRKFPRCRHAALRLAALFRDFRFFTPLCWHIHSTVNSPRRPDFLQIAPDQDYMIAPSSLFIYGLADAQRTSGYAPEDGFEYDGSEDEEMEEEEEEEEKEMEEEEEDSEDSDEDLFLGPRLLSSPGAEAYVAVHPFGSFGVHDG